MSAVSVVQVGVQAEPCDLASWTALARRLESDGFAALLMGDHPASGASPWTALGAAAAVTDTLGVGTYVLNTGVCDPVRIAAEAATLNLLVPGRVHLGLGAGHTPVEWTQIGLTRPDAAARVQRLAETLEVVAALLAGEVVTHHGEHLHLLEARLQDLPTTAAGAAPVRVIVGGGNRALLALAARHADVVALSGLGRTLGRRAPPRGPLGGAGPAHPAHRDRRRRPRRRLQPPARPGAGGSGAGGGRNRGP